jgi:hypothetical protein
VDITANSSDNVGVTKVEIYVDSNLRCTLNAAPYVCPFTVSSTGGTSYMIHARAFDAAGNMRVSNSNKLTVTVPDTTAPTVTLMTPQNNLSVSPGQVSVSVNASDNVGVTKVEVFMTGVLKCTLTAAPYTCTISTNTAGGLNYTILARAYDAAGNMSNSTTNTLIVLPADPTRVTNMWTNLAFANKLLLSTQFSASVTAANADAVIGFSNGPADDYSDLAVAVRFNPTGTIDVRNGADYAAAVTMPYARNQVFKFRIIVNIAAKTYNVYVTPPSGSEQALAINYAFRTEQLAIARFNNRADITSLGVVNITEFSVAP